MPILRAIRRYPVKSLDGEPLDSIELAAGRRLPGDRRFAFAPVATLPGEPPFAWTPKARLLALVRLPQLAAIRSAFDPATRRLVLRKEGATLAQGAVDDPADRATLEAAMLAEAGVAGRGALRLLEATDDGGFTDQPAPWLGLVGSPSIVALGQRLGDPSLDPRRFRMNLEIDGPAPWEEREWTGRTLRIGGALLKVEEYCERCGATELHPETGVRDRRTLAALRGAYGHEDMGVFVSVALGGRITVGDAVEPL